MINTRLYNNMMLALIGALIVLFPTYLLVKTYSSASSDKLDDTPHFVGRETCIECHLPEYNDWVGSHHDRAMDIANDTTVLANFNNVSIEGNGMTHRAFMKDGKFMVNTDGEDGTMQDFEVKYVFGFTPLQQFLVEFDGGRLQTLPLTWNTLDSTWYHMVDSVYSNQDIHHNNWLHWTNQAQNWNSMCADCHSTNLQKNYDHINDTYNTTWSEIDVSCEACHGPSSNHLKWAELPEYARDDFENYGLPIKTSGINNEQYVDNCARCHSRRSSLGDFDYTTHNIHNHIIPNLPDVPTWHLDGQILDEDYVYASFTQSKMYTKEREVQCNDCHNVHSGKLLFGDDYNALCLQCHTGDVYDTPDHHFHKAEGMPGEAVTSYDGITYEVGSGTLCINCHMHGGYYMGVDYRRDHSFRVPRPDLSIKYDVPNACNQCHADKSNQWSENYITKWYGKSRTYHFAQAFDDARNGNEEALQRLKTIANDELYPHNIRGLSIQYMGNYFQDSLKQEVENYLGNLYPDMRLAAVRAIQLTGEEDLNLLYPMLRDDTKAIRTEAARILSTAGLEQIPEKHRKLYDKAIKEYEEILIYNADFPIGKFNLANYYYNQDNYTDAETFYLRALKQDEELHFIKLNLAYLYNKIKKNDKAELLFRDYLKHEPEDAVAMYSFGLLLSELQKYDESLTYMVKSYNLQPERPRVAHNIAMMFDFRGNKAKAEAYLKKEVELIDNYNSNGELLRFYLNNQMKQQALQLATQMKKDYPEAEELNQVIEQLQ
ncbi:multiheme c-type cytochrome [Carboxylicivirga marina]|uniref:Tetratricopeptide repeat protein n=1 Tax=Carboxylicivirga marina TaxID=2800988 RepID=A0ABS1HM87_9BACT|nr:cytochrome c3 family protein [Carboxylicivirga marina]MBK3518368.1 tetratricopeptide repeat protein [Carboxylicivirga marina]